MNYCAIGGCFTQDEDKMLFRAVAHSLAIKGYTLRANCKTKASTNDFISGVEGYAFNKKKNIEELLEVYMEKHKIAGKVSGQKGYINCVKLPHYNKAKQIAEDFGVIHLKDDTIELAEYTAITYMTLGKNLDTPPKFVISDCRLFETDMEGSIIDGKGLFGQMVRILKRINANTTILNIHIQEHREN